MQNSPTSNGNANDPLWYKDAIIYEAHVRAFYDSNADGMGDFRGLAEKLDYLEDLGVTAIWLLPFFPSPWKDDGYDISDFREVHPAYGNLRDFQHFLREAHRRNLRVITELVVNHTSDQHEWFQKSRRAEPGSNWRNFYVWSNSPDRYNGTRIIFKDFEPSNWSWDPVAKAYYWHRFYSHQPDLNFDSPLVRRTVMRTLDYWAQMGVDGFRLDAIPYLYEREGTSCENLPETHAFLKELRAHMDATYPGRMFLAEANMWPEDAVAYFGKGDECHVSFHFPLMPRLFMALRLEDRLPIVEILNRTPEIPETCQWAMFLRNHDELTLEMVTDEERDYMYRVYASDQRARINLGIRRRLAPLLGNDRQRIEVMNALLFSMPGTPVLYYGDEIGMGDNVYLGDRNGVRTPMQWSPDRNAGFSAANPQQLYLPVNIDPAYHYEAINVETQQGNPNSLLNWTKRLIALRKQYKAFGRGTIEFLQPSNQRVLAFIRRYENETILVVANLSRFAQAVELDLPKFNGCTPVEMFGQTDFPVIGDSYYPVTLGPSSFFWFSLEQRAAPVTVATSGDTRRAQTPVLALPALADVWSAEIHGSLASILPTFLANARWFRGENRRIRSLRVLDSVPVAAGKSAMMLVRIEYASGDPEEYFIPIAMARDEEAQTIRGENPESALAEVRAADGSTALLYDGAINSQLSTALLEAFARRKRLHGERGSVIAQRNRRFRQLWGGTHPNFDPKLLNSEINTSIQFGDRFVLKLLRRVEPGPHSGVEMGQYLAGDGPQTLPFIAPFAGDMVYQADSGESITLTMLHGFVKNDGNAWDGTFDHLRTFIDKISSGQYSRSDIEGLAPANFYSLSFALNERAPLAAELIGPYLDLIKIMGRRTAEMHLALTRDSTDPAFSPEPFNDFYRQSLYHGYIGLTNRRLEFVRKRYPEMTDEMKALASKVLDLEPAILAKFKAIFEERIASMRTRFHGRLHLGHMLMTGDDISIFDFEGDPAQHLSERRIKRCPLRDVASMLVSFGYAAQTAMLHFLLTDKSKALTRHDLRMWGRFWYAHVSASFMEAYWNVAGHASYMPASQADQETLLSTYMLERAMLDIRPDISDRPEFAGTPLRIVLHILSAEDDLNARE